MLFLDLDDFKRVNDHAGHAAGDAVLIAAAERIRRCVRPTDLAARLGGDEFAVLLEDADERHGEEIAHRIVALLCEAVTISGRPCWVRASIGIGSAAAGSGMDADDLMRHADIAMYRAKEAGKGQVLAFTPEMHPNSLTKAPSRDELLAALDAGEFVAHYQPIVARRHAARSSPPRRSCAGTTRATACSRRRRSCPPPSRPGRSRRSTASCSSRRAARRPRGPPRTATRRTRPCT